LPVKNPSAFAYCVVAKDGLTVAKVVEKEVISDKPQFDPLVVGTFWFRRAGDFKRAARSLIDKDIRVNGEHYVGTSINQLIEQGAKFVIFDIDQWISYGDPFELQIMEFWQDHFRERGPAYRRDRKVS
jgi:dTDP-glucose pyrophosphorylase